MGEEFNNQEVINVSAVVNAFIREVFTQISSKTFELIDKHLTLFACIKDPEVFKKRVIEESSSALSLYFGIKNSELLKVFVEVSFDMVEDNG